MARKRQLEPGANSRSLRIGEAIRHALAGLLPHAHFRDPALLDISVTVTEARVAPDLRNVLVFVLPLGGKNPDEIVAALNRASPYLRGEVARAVRMKFAPQLRFAVDRTFDRSQHIADLLQDTRVRRDLGGDDKNG